MERRRVLLLALAATLLVAGPTRGHAPGDTTAGRTLPTPATHAELATYATLLGTRPALAATFGDTLAVAVTPGADGQLTVAAIDLYLKLVHRMPGVLPPDHRISGIHLRGDLVAFRVDAPAGAYDYLWDSEEPGPPFWKLTGARSGKVTHSPNVAESLVATFYLRDPHVTAKWIQADALRKARKFEEVQYIDGAVLILTAANAAENLAFRWLRNRWTDAGTIPGAVNHHAVADLNGDGLIEVLAGDTEVVETCTRTWGALYTWNAAKTRVVPAGVRAESANNLSGTCAETRPACFRQESLNWDRQVRSQTVVKIDGTLDTSGCPGSAQAAENGIYRRRFAWDAKQEAFVPLAN